MNDLIQKAVAHIKANDNVSTNCAICNITKQAMRVISGERKKSEAVRVLFYSKNPASHPKWQYHALNLQIQRLLGA